MKDYEDQPPTQQQIGRKVWNGQNINVHIYFFRTMMYQRGHPLLVPRCGSNGQMVIYMEQPLEELKITACIL